MVEPLSGVRLSVVVVSYNTRDYLHRCLLALERFPPREGFEIVVIDNASSDGSPEMVGREHPAVRLIRSHRNEGYGAAVNVAVPETRGEFVLLLNPDTEVTSGALDALLDFARGHLAAGVVGPRLLLGNGEPQASARRFPSATLLLLEALRLQKLLPARWRSRLLLGTYFSQDVSRKVPWVSGACHLIPRHVWERVGPLTEETFCGFDDLDYCIRARRAGYATWLRTDATVVHHCSIAVRDRWSPWEVEQVAIHSAYVVLSDAWPKWRVKAYGMAEAVTWLIEILLGALSREGGGAANHRLRQRLRLTLRLLVGLEAPRRRFQPGAGEAPRS
jgi:hypothetical protein